MSSVTFGAIQQKAAEQPAAAETPAVDAEVVQAEQTEALGQPANTGVSTHVNDPYNEGGVVGEVGDSDIQLPRVRLIQGTSKFASNAPVGTLTLGNDGDLLVLAKEGQKVPFVVVEMRKQFQEKIPWGTDRLPRMCNSAEEVAAAGGQVNAPKGAGFYDSIAHAKMFVGLPASARDDHPQADLVNAMFLFEFDGLIWAPAVYTASGMSYTAFAKSIFTAQRFQLKNLWEGMFTMHGSEVNTNFGPKKKLNASFLRKFTPEETAEFLSCINGND